MNSGDSATRRRTGLWIAVGVTCAVLALLAGTAVLVVRPWTPEFRHGGLTVAESPAPVQAVPRLLPADDTAAPSPAAVAAALAGPIANPDLGDFSGVVTDAETGITLWSSAADQPRIPSSTNKVLTAAAALLALPADQRVVTKVVAGTAPNELVLVGGGDPTLTAQPDGKGYYPNSARLSDLVGQIQAAGRAVDTIVVDTSLFTGPTMAEGWEDIDVPQGSIAPIESVMIDGGRAEALVEYSPRTTTPALDAGRTLAVALGLDPNRVRVGVADPGAADLASVRSAPLRDRLHAMMLHSDNVLAETIGREVALATGHEPSFDGAATAVRATLQDAGFDLTGVVLHDSSGLSTADRLPAHLLDDILAAAARAGGEVPVSENGTTADTAGQGRTGGYPELTPMLDALPVAGATGSLAPRYVQQNREGAGWVRAKTGTLTVASTLAGYVLDRDGRVLTFALMSNDRPPEVSRPALDAIARTLRNCGCS